MGVGAHHSVVAELLRAVSAERSQNRKDRHDLRNVFEPAGIQYESRVAAATIHT